MWPFQPSRIQITDTGYVWLSHVSPPDVENPFGVAPSRVPVFEYSK